MGCSGSVWRRRMPCLVAVSGPPQLTSAGFSNSNKNIVYNMQIGAPWQGPGRQSGKPNHLTVYASQKMRRRTARWNPGSTRAQGSKRRKNEPQSPCCRHCHAAAIRRCPCGACGGFHRGGRRRQAEHSVDHNRRSTCRFAGVLQPCHDREGGKRTGVRHLDRIAEVRVFPFSPDKAPPRSKQANDFYRVQMPSLPLTDTPFERMRIRCLGPPFCALPAFLPNSLLALPLECNPRGLLQTSWRPLW
jgi:hypothetical protein